MDKANQFIISDKGDNQIVNRVCVAFAYIHIKPSQIQVYFGLLIDLVWLGLVSNLIRYSLNQVQIMLKF